MKKGQVAAKAKAVIGKVGRKMARPLKGNQKTILQAVHIFSLTSKKEGKGVSMRMAEVH